MNHKEISKELLSFIDKSPTAFQAIDSFADMLSGAEELSEGEKWDLKEGRTYFVKRNGSSLIAFRIPETIKEDVAFQIVATHSDCPLLKIKPRGEIAVENHYQKLNVEKYGGLIHAPWLDRPLSVAGRILVREAGNSSKVTTRLVDLKRDVALIPNLAIHLNKQINEGYAYNPQIDLLPLFSDISEEGMTKEESRKEEPGKEKSDFKQAEKTGQNKSKLLELVAREVGVCSEDILGADLFLYNRTQGTVWGANEEFISSRSLDDLQCAYAMMRSFLSARNNPTGICVASVFDNEEVGSLTKQGADSTFFQDVLSRIWKTLGLETEGYVGAISRSFMISADNAHAVHPNHPDKSDPTNRPFLNGGVVMKVNANQKYTTDAISEAVLKLLCEKAAVPLQTYANRSDLPGGSTLGNLSNAHVSLNTVDIGLPQLAMHSPYETAGVKDTAYMFQLMKCFYETGIKMEKDGFSLI